MFSNYDYDVIIIGGGISGLFLAYKLSNTNLKIIVLEGSSGLGGRIQTIKKEDISYEAGAARFHTSHTKIMTLINEIDLQEDTIKLPKEIKYKLAKKSKVSVTKLLQEAFEKKKKFSHDHLKNITFFQYLVTVFDFDTAEFIQESFGYDSEIIDLNAHAALIMFEDDLFKDGDYFILKNGMSSIIGKLETILKLSPNVFIKTNCLVKEIQDSHIITMKDDKFFYDHLICAIPKKPLQSFQYFKDNNISNLIDSVDPYPLLRIYAKYPSKDVWFKKIKRTITNNYIRQIIPIDYDNGLIMISYTDGKYAEMWNQYNVASIDNEILIEALHKEIKELFNITPPQPEFVSTHYWTDGLHLWNTGYDINEVSKQILKPYNDKNIYICNEAYSKKQGWIEGCLSMCYELIKKINIGYQIVTDKEDCFKEIVEKQLLIEEEEVEQSEEDEEGEQSEEDEESDLDLKKIKMKQYGIDEVLRNEEWMVLEVKGEKIVYDISKFIKDHPGQGKIFNGVEANMYYKDKTIQPISPTEIFNNNPHHVNNDAKSKYLLTNNKKVVPIGVLISK